MTITLGRMIGLVFPDYDPERTKLHLAQWNGLEHPLDVYYAGEFDGWQRHQTRRNFDRDYVLALIQTARSDIWLFAGLWRRIGEPTFGPDVWALSHGEERRDLWCYNLEYVTEVDDLAGRLHVRYQKTARAAYRRLETLAEDLQVASLVEAPRMFPRFSSYRETRLSFADLRLLEAKAPEDWRTALSAVSGVYLITDKDGAQYVGSAYGAEGFWGRWMFYARTGHGENKLLKKRVGSVTKAGAAAFNFTILETHDLSASAEDVIRREAWWKTVLGSRAHGLNAN